MHGHARTGRAKHQIDERCGLTLLLVLVNRTTNFSSQWTKHDVQQIPKTDPDTH